MVSHRQHRGFVYPAGDKDIAPVQMTQLVVRDLEHHLDSEIYQLALEVDEAAPPTPRESLPLDGREPPPLSRLGSQPRPESKATEPTSNEVVRT